MADMDDPIFTMWLPAHRGIDKKSEREIWINEPMGKGRPRGRIIFPKGPKKAPPFISFYPDPDSAKYEAVLAAAGAAAYAGQPVLLGPLTAYIEVFVPVSESWTKKRKAACLSGEEACTAKPDGDNYAKIVGDALNKIVWDDDAQIVMWQIFKSYSATPGMRVSVWHWEVFRPKQEKLL